MDWFRILDNYCERTDPSYWSEPVNALSNGAFLVAAWLCWRRADVRADPGARALTLVLAVIGVGSFLFHTHAQLWSMFADVLPILGFILIYVGLATSRFFGLPGWAGLLAAVAYVPYSAVLSRGIEAVAGPVNGSVGYMPVVVLIAGFAVALRGRAPDTARGLGVGAAILVLSLTFRSMDSAVCAAWPLGTHFLWHILNGIMLGWMIVVMARFRARGLARAGASG